MSEKTKPGSEGTQDKAKTTAKQTRGGTAGTAKSKKTKTAKTAATRNTKRRGASKRPKSARGTRTTRAARITSPKQWWAKATLGQKIKATLVSLVAIICVMALAMGTVRFVQWRIEVRAAEARQAELVKTYDFDPGDIISDGQFFNANALSQAEIQSFLDKEGAQCTGNDCLKSKTFDTTDQPADEYCSAYSGAKHETAAAIIYKAGKACGISQKILLTVLQKEQHLVTATEITDSQYKSAMGLSCPDDANCDPEYAGFFKQVYGSAKRYQYYVAHEDRYGYHANALNFIQYHPNKACGGTNVFIDNKATALLYIYTPYQPNDAALAAGVGEGDACSSYGNRNFAIIYQSWFGSMR
ncbi:hemagglutinin [Bifidobacterium sp. SO1]|uniref:hemagglutinin n=1 Tax=Bifidobacterium sp. SO1 TaxID=2809029 RepID=UPI001F0B496C|nr:hemagglutinin [Bifidobacterium sp. SO1]